MHRQKLLFLFSLFISLQSIKAQTFLGEGISMTLDSAQVSYFSFKSHIDYTKPLFCINDDTSITMAMPKFSKAFAIAKYRAENSEMAPPADIDSTLCLDTKGNKHYLKAAFQLADSVTNKTVMQLDSTDNDMIMKILNRVSTPEEADCFAKMPVIEGYKVKIETASDSLLFYDLTFILDSSGNCGGNSGRVIALTKPNKVVNCLRQY